MSVLSCVGDKEMEWQRDTEEFLCEGLGLSLLKALLLESTLRAWADTLN